MVLNSSSDKPRYRALTRSNIERSAFWNRIDPELQDVIKTTSLVLPFRANEYVVDQLINWDRVPDDPMFQLTFPQRGMLSDRHFARIQRLVDQGADKSTLDAQIKRVRAELNPHPAGQMTHNVPRLAGHPLEGVQHKYRETVLYFPSHGQTCHAYCTFCFRWAQFVGDESLRFASKKAEQLAAYVRSKRSISDVLITGGDPLIMKTHLLEQIIEPLLEIESLSSIRIGSKALSYWPYRFTTDDDADDLLRLFERVVKSGKHLALMAHFSHPVELSTSVAKEAVRRVRNTGAAIRMQSPVLRHINDDAHVWSTMWRKGVQLGCVPYYMFVERDTGARGYFEMPLVRCWNIFRNAYQQVSGLARTVRGPSMSCFPGKCHVLGVTDIGGRQAFCLEFLQAREPDLVRRPFFAKFDPKASWYSQLEPFSRSDEEFFIRPPKPPTELNQIRIISNN